MLRWNEVRRLIVQYAAPALVPLGFEAPGRTMRRWRRDFVDVIDFRCGKWNDRIAVSFGCGLRQFLKQNAKPSDCTFSGPRGPTRAAWPDKLLAFKNSEREQIDALQAFAPVLADEAQRWFGLLPDLTTVRSAIEKETFDGPIAGFAVPSPAYHDAVQKLESLLAKSNGDDSASP